MYYTLFRDALHPWKRCIVKGCIFVYWHACRWYDWTGFNSAKLLSSTCSIANINVEMVDSSPPKLMRKLWRDALCFHVSVDEYFWLGFNSAEVAYLFTWRQFSIPVFHLTWFNETVPSCVKCIINFSGMLCILENGALQKDAYLCIDVCVGDMTGQGSREDYSALLRFIWHDLTRQC